jgi:hypothetical protein
VLWKRTSLIFRCQTDKIDIRIDNILKTYEEALSFIPNLNFKLKGGKGIPIYAYLGKLAIGRIRYDSDNEYSSMVFTRTHPYSSKVPFNDIGFQGEYSISLWEVINMSFDTYTDEESLLEFEKYIFKGE